MTPEVEQALKDSIAHWERMLAAGQPKSWDDVHAKKEQPRSRDCALCQLMADKNCSCEYCPIFGKTGLWSCAGTPFHVAQAAFYEQEGNFQETFQAEIDFLKSLLPPAKTTSDPV